MSSSPTPVRVSAQDRRQQILSEATELFARQGFEGTTTREIAERVGVNEAILFRHFPSKEELYWSVIDNQCNLRGGIERWRELLSRPGDESVVLTGLAEDLLRRNVTFTRLTLFTALENHRLSQRLFRTHVAQYYEILAEYLRERMEAGKFRKCDPLLAARCFLGMLVYHFQIQELYGAKRYQHFEVADVARTFVDIWLRGIQSAATARSHCEPQELR